MKEKKMKLSTKGRYGARAALELAVRYGSGPVMVRQIAESQNISVRYLEHILNVLRASSIVKSTRGARGGYELARKPTEITLGEIIRSLEGPLDIVPCTEDHSCKRLSECIMIEIWGEVKNAIENIIDSVTLADMAGKLDNLNKHQANEYII